jgi:hypothetical protein
MTFVQKKVLRAHESNEKRWIQINFSSSPCLILAVHTGSMMQENADIIVIKTGEKITDEELQVFVTNGHKFYLKHY